jgi:hypothetical protein
LRGIVFPQGIQVGNSTALQDDRKGTHSKILPQLCYTVNQAVSNSSVCPIVFNGYEGLKPNPWHKGSRLEFPEDG